MGGEREGEKYQLTASHACPYQGNRTHNLGMCPKQELNL